MSFDRRRSRWGLLTLLLLLLTSCTKPAPAPGLQPDAGAVGSAPAVPADEPPGWRYITTVSGDGTHVAGAAPDGSAFLLLDMEQKPLLVTMGATMRVETPTTRSARFRTDESELEVTLFETPFGMFHAQPPGEVVFAPDYQRVAIRTQTGLWVGEMATGAVRRVTSDPPTEVAGRHPQNPLIWAGTPRWSEDGRWLYFEANRPETGRLAAWRVPADGGPEELLAEPLPALPEAVAGQVAQARGLVLRDLSPDGAWAGADEFETPAFQVLNLKDPAQSIRHEAPPGRYAGPGTFSPDSRQVLVASRPRQDLHIRMGVMSLPNGHVRWYAFPRPADGVVTPIGWVGNHQVLVEIAPYNATYSDRAWPSPRQLWLLDLTRAPEAGDLAGTPTRLSSVLVDGGRYWRQSVADGAVVGGEVAVVRPADVILALDAPLSAGWIAQHVTVEGGVVDAFEASLGVLIVHQGAEGGPLRVKVDALGFDLRVRQAAAPTVTLEVRPEGGDWAPADAERVWPRGPLDLRFRFSKPMNETVTAEAVRKALADPLHAYGRSYPVTNAELRWEEGALLVHLPTPPPRVVLVPHEAVDTEGLQLADWFLPLIRTGELPALVAAGESDTVLTTVPVEVARAAVTPDGRSVLLDRAVADRNYYRSVWRYEALDLTTFRLTAREGQTVPEPAGKGLQGAVRSGDRVAGFELGAWVEPGRQEGALVIREMDGRELRRVTGFRYVPSLRYASAVLAWAPDGRHVGLVLSTGQGLQLHLIDAETGAMRVVGEPAAFFSIEWSPSGRQVAVGNQILDVATGKTLFKGRDHRGIGFRWNAAETRLLYNEAEWREVVEADLTTGETRQLGVGLPVGFDRLGRPLVIRWADSQDRYWQPPYRY